MKKLLYLFLALTVACSSGDDSTPEQNNDTTPPVITLNGSANVSVTQGDSYVDEGVTASDNIDGDLTSSISVSGNVDTATIGNYSLTYSVTDSSGNNTSIIRNVEVTDINPYLVGAWTATFSDGNSTAVQILTLNSDGTGSVANEWDDGETFFSELIWTSDVTTIFVTTLINNESDSGDYELSNSNDTFVITINGQTYVYVRI